MTDPRAEIQKIEEDIRRLEELKQSGALPPDLADVSIAALKSKLPTYQAELQGDGAIAQGDNSKAAGARAVMADGDIDSSVFVTGDHVEVNLGAPRAKKESLREAYLSYVLEQVSPLALSGVVRQSAGEAETRMNLGSIYTALLATPGDLFNELLETLDLSPKTFDTLKKSGLKTIGEIIDLLGNREDVVMSIRNLGEKSLDQLRDKMREKGFMNESRKLVKISVLLQINQFSRCVLLGDPGSGKSTFINFVALCMAGEALGREDANLKALTHPLPQDQNELSRLRDEEKTPEPQPWDHGALIPVRIILRDFAAHGLPPQSGSVSAEHIWNFMEAELNTAALNDFAPLLKKELRERGGLILFDGLDEVPEAEDRRAHLLTAIESFAAAFPRCRFLVTSRTYAYENQDWKLKGFAEVKLAPFTREQIKQFVERWYEHITLLQSKNPQDGKGKAEALKRAIFANERLMSLAERPLLLTLMASLHAWRGGTLPDKRERLYADAVDLLLERWESQRIIRDPKTNEPMLQPSLAEWLKVDRDKVRDLLNQLAYEAHAGQGELVGTADVPESALIMGLMNLSQNPNVKPKLLIQYLRDRAGLLIPRGVGVYTFPHRTFQEYLAACHLTDHDYPYLIAKLTRTEPNRWREVALLAGAKAASGAAVFALWSLVDSLSPERENGDGEACYWGAQIAGQAVIEIADLEKVSESTQTKVDRLRARLLDIMEGNHLPAVERAQAGINLSALGDPRFNSDLWHLPADETLGFTLIPAGKFLMGSDDRDDEKPQHEVPLPDFWMARYPVTVAQFKAFTEATKYSFDYWQYNYIATHPVVAVTWYEALKYAEWLDKELRQHAEKQVKSGVKNPLWQGLAEGNLHITLPSEAEWEKAARGGSPRLLGEGRGGEVYPWQGGFDPDKANTSETKIGDPSVVGCFPAGASPYGLLDVSGNVWEWTRSLWGKDYSKPSYKYPYNPKDGERENLKAENEVLRVLRGGSFPNEASDARCAARVRCTPDDWHLNRGFRVVVVSPALPSRRL
jgi:formylglycine-generating enzyme required for sulfatase activity